MQGEDQCLGFRKLTLLMNKNKVPQKKGLQQDNREVGGLNLHVR